MVLGVCRCSLLVVVLGTHDVVGGHLSLFIDAGGGHVWRLVGRVMGTCCHALLVVVGAHDVVGGHSSLY